jgi:hypothetical protein
MREVSKQELEERYLTDAEFHASAEEAVNGLERSYALNLGENRSLAILAAAYALMATEPEPEQPAPPPPA